MKESEAGGYTPDDLHELSFAVGHSGELFFHLGTNMLKSNWMNSYAKGLQSVIKGFKTELKATYDLETNSPDQFPRSINRQLTTTASFDMLLYDKLAIAATYARLAPECGEAEMQEFSEVSAFAEHEDFSCNAKFDYNLKKRQLMNKF